MGRRAEVTVRFAGGVAVGVADDPVGSWALAMPEVRATTRENVVRYRVRRAIGAG